MRFELIASKLIFQDWLTALQDNLRYIQQFKNYILNGLIVHMVNEPVKQIPIRVDVPK